MDNHYNPQFYLRQWAGPDGKLLRYCLVKTGAIVEKPVAPRGTSYEPDLYATPPAVEWETHDPHLIEKEVMTPIDSRASLVLTKLVSEMQLDLTNDDRTAWATFLNSLPHRHRDAIIERDAIAPQVAREVMARLIARCPDPQARERVGRRFGFARVEKMAKTAHRANMVQAIRNPTAIEFLTKQLAWDVLVVHPAVPLITTDRPLLVNLGKGGPTQIMTMPLSPTRLFVAYPAEWQTKADAAEVSALFGQIASVHDLLLLNEQPCRYVYSSQKIENGFIVGDTAIHVRRAVEQALARWSRPS